MKLPFVGNRLGGTLFYDGGNVYSDVNHISFALEAALDHGSRTIFRTRWDSALRYPTPIGPVRVDFGYQLNPAQYQANEFRDTIRPQTLRLPHFQFFFNIGPIF